MSGPNPRLVAWLRTRTAAPLRKRCLVVGCGRGDDAEALASAGFEVTAFDAAPAAIAACQERFRRSGVEYVVADLLAPPADWLGAFDLVFESASLEALGPEARAGAMRAMAQLVAPGGRVLVVCRAREASDPEGGSPGALTREELGTFESAGLRASAVEIVVDAGPPPVRRFIAFFDQPMP
jgi:SAM-dependent methyltransferase